jgi:multidrug resistance efflux pump
MSTTFRPTHAERIEERTQQRRGRPWWHFALALAVLLALAGLVWAGYAIWFSVAHVRASYARVTGLVIQVAAKNDSRVRQVLVRTGDEVETGQVVATLDQASLEAEVERAEATLSAQRSELARAERELELTIRETSASVEEAEAQLAAAAARLRQSEAELKMQSEQLPDEVRQAQADVDAATSRLLDAKARLARMEKLRAQGAVSEQSLDEARMGYGTAQAGVESAEAALAVARAGDYQSQIREQSVATREAEHLQARAGLKSAQTQGRRVALSEQAVVARQAAVAEAEAVLEAAQSRLSDAVLRSPVNGVVVKGPGHSVKDGEIVETGAPIVTVLSTEVPFWISASVSELYSGLVREGQPVRIRIDSLDRGIFHRRWLQGTVEKVGAATEFQATEGNPWMVQQVPIKITFDAEGEPVKAGATCRAWIDIRER